jgi:23S rRNA pseudouridine1911/1915/1917 synthase
LADQQEVLITVTAEEAGGRLDRVLASRLAGTSRAKLQRLIAAGDVTLNGRVAKAKDPVAAGDVLAVATAAAQASPPARLAPVAMRLAVLYEDEHLLVLDKPAGIAVHPGAGDTGPTLVQGLLAHCAGRLGRATGGKPELAAERPGIVHRLDKDTSGVMVCAKTDAAHAALAKQFHDKTNDREYLALLDGVLAGQAATIESWLHRDPNARLKYASTTPSDYAALAARLGQPPRGYRWAKSAFQVDRVFHERLTLARVRLFTGRTHQIRVHALALGAPILGDPLYHPGSELPARVPVEVRAAVRRLGRQMLHAQLLGFTHPATGERLTFTAPAPPDFGAMLALLAEAPV